MAGTSSDSLIGDNGLVEVKYSQPAMHMFFLQNSKIKLEYNLTNVILNDLHKAKMV